MLRRYNRTCQRQPELSNSLNPFLYNNTLWRELVKRESEKFPKIMIIPVLSLNSGRCDYNDCRWKRKKPHNPYRRCGSQNRQNLAQAEQPASGVNSIQSDSRAGVLVATIETISSPSGIELCLRSLSSRTDVAFFRTPTNARPLSVVWILTLATIPLLNVTL